jgi:GNAT superfamily N-acetyltransferase
MSTTGKASGGETRAGTPPVRGPHGTPESLDVASDTSKAIALEDGTPLALRLASGGDSERLRRLFYRLSPATIYRRLFLPVPKVPHWAAYFVTLVARDSDLRQAVVALKGDEVVGFANFAREEATTCEAETAIIVEDAWQRRGIGRRLMGEVVGQAWRPCGLPAHKAPCERRHRELSDLLCDGRGRRRGPDHVLTGDGRYGSLAPLPEGKRVAITVTSPSPAVITACVDSPGAQGDPCFATYHPGAVSLAAWSADGQSFLAATVNASYGRPTTQTGSLVHYTLGSATGRLAAVGYGPWSAP